MGKILIVSVLISFSFGCQKATSELVAGEFSGIDLVPEIHEDIESGPEANPHDSEEKTSPDNVKPEVEKTPLKKEDKKVAEQESQIEPKPSSTKASILIKAAERVRIYEGRKIGTACNHYLQRVLVVAGFAPGSFLANDFDQYARKYFNYYKSVDFKNDNSGSDRERLKKHLWSYPERAPFIMQWTSTKSYGHVAIVERIGDKLVTYQASLNRFTARRNATTVHALLNGFNRRTLTVYSEFQD